jgi:hypothetical protein
MKDAARVTKWLPSNEGGFLLEEKHRLDADPSGMFTCSIREDPKTHRIALFYDKIYFSDGTMFHLHQYDRIESNVGSG